MSDFFEDAAEYASPGDTLFETTQSMTPPAPGYPGYWEQGGGSMWNGNIGQNNGVYSGVAMPSLGRSDSKADANKYMTSLEKIHRANAERMAMDVEDPTSSMRAGIALADIDSMKSGYNALVMSGWDHREAAHTMGMVGAVFGSYAKAEENAQYLKRYAENRGTDLPSAVREFGAFYKQYRAHWLQHYGFSPSAKPDPSFDESIRRSFSDLIGGIRSIEDKYSWQFNAKTYEDVMTRSANIVSDLAVSGVDLSDVGAEDVVRAAMYSNGALTGGDPNSSRAARLVAAQDRDRKLITLFGDDGTLDPMVNPYKASSADGRDPRGGNVDSGDFGMTRSLRQAFFDHRARNLRHGLDSDNFDNTEVLRSDLITAFREFSTSGADVSDDMLGKLADHMINSVSNGKPASVTGSAKIVARNTRNSVQANRLAKWVRSATLGTAEGQQRLNGLAVPFVERYAAQAGLTPKDPLVVSFSARVFRALKRRYQDLEGAYGLEELEGMTSAGKDSIIAQLEKDLGVYVTSFRDIAEAKNKAAADRKEAMDN